MVHSMNLLDQQPKGNNPKKSKTPFVEGQVIAVFFKSPDSFYKVLLVKIAKTNLDWDQEKIVITGNFGDIDEDKKYIFKGHLVHHPKYGTQFKASSYKNDTPDSRKGLIAYLSGSDFPGIGQQTAKRIVDALGLNLIEEVLSDPKILKPLNLRKNQYQSVVDGINANNGIEQIIIELNSYGFGSHLASEIFNKYHENTLDVIHNNPYRLVEDINGVSFKKADRIAKKSGISDNSKGRLKAGLMTALRQLSSQDGGTYTTTGPLLEQSMKLLNTSRDDQINGDMLATAMVQLAHDHKIVGDGKRIYLASLYNAEWEIADNLNRIQSDEANQQACQTFSMHNIMGSIRKIEQKLNIDYDDSQVSALVQSMKNPVFLLTGGPGTGKTTIIEGIVSLFADLNHLSLDLTKYKDKPYPVLLAAPTGRAAKRMNETTHIPASTIHRLLGLNSYDDNGTGNTVTKELKGGILIIDEMSMVDTYLFRILVKSIPSDMKVILVGDKDQLPSVGPGQVFSDLLSSNEIPKLELNTIHRQDSNSTIIPLAHSIKDGYLPKNFTSHMPDRSFIACNSAQIGSVIRQIVELAKQKGFTSTDMQVLAPMYRGEAGINHLNEIIQEIMNPRTSSDQVQVEYNGMKYRIGDKVLQLVNSPENDIFNGDIGEIVGIDKDSKGRQSRDKITIDFDQAEVTYSRNRWNQISLAYCTSIHKAQGSEFKMVILPMVPQYYVMLKRNLLYTAVSRASKMLVLIGDYNSFLKCVDTASVNRNTTLAVRLQQVIGHKKPEDISTQSSTELALKTKPKKFKVIHKPQKPKSHVLTPELIQSRAIDPMIGMKGISPMTFMKSNH
ncbi:ATP-dependent RecD-like DNA helicase [uncultured bacterium]|uniref:ATP-dependent RecD2 DNA helicase n=2 Tax=Acetilactobacillus jinshanensis TaxID=1720083 RepID=A0A4P6ZKF6_9LACO|nr:ATP-dependent RecD-like DNA helicase [Acetilactobacillus jinshanensis]URL60775.1 ATP-dependent RecD-like DNA helicase [uncultured bacterium]